MNDTEQIIKANDTEQIREYAALLMSIPDIAALIGIEPDSLTTIIADRTNPLSKAYYLGKAQTIYNIRKQEIELAKNGSPTAVEQAAAYILEQAQYEL
jgi:hypothetical protein